MPPPSIASADWHLYTLIIVWVAYHLLEQLRSYLDSKHSYLPPFAAKKVAPKPLGAGVTGEFLLILLHMYHYKAIEVTSNEVSCDN